ncbi:ATP-dependent DNA ligase [Scheffersomyces coipomensis]|uniref:ATP-dependent DNA ligase n=1 Tax=Scheffersomyces coipomensis TaxID=1788519 RepID=UPI00315C6BAD
MSPQQQSIARFFGGSAANVQSASSSPAKKKIKSEQSDVVIASSSVTPPPSEFKDDTDPSESEELITDKKSNKVELQQAEELINLSQVEQVKHKDEVLGAKIPYAKLTEIFDKIESESSRLKIISIVSQFFLEILQQSSIDKLVKIVYLFINRLGPDYEPDLELGLGETLLIKAISECYGRPPSKIKKDYQEVGDLGSVAQKSRSGQPTMFKPQPLDIDVVFENLTNIAKSTGKDSQSKKINIINRMLTACNIKSNEAKFLIRSLEGKLRIGLAEKTVLISLAQAFLIYESKSSKKVNPERLTQVEDIIREAFSTIPNYEVIITKAYEYGIDNLLDHCQLTPGIPLKPMLAKPTKSITEVLDRFQGEEFTCEYKYDGERAQVHLLADGTIRIYSRNSEDMSQRYPDLISILREVLNSKEAGVSMVLDCEAVAWDRTNNKILPFQVLSTRKRKDVDEKDIKVHICLFAFDLLYYNNQALITKSLNERRVIMKENLNEIEGRFQFATARNSSNLDELQQFLDQSVKDACEGLMVKMLNGKDSYYEPSKRSRNWLKLKKDYLQGVGDSLDLVVIGGYIGRGKRTGNYGGFLLASYNQDTGEYETTCKIGTGFSDEDLSTIHARLKPTEISQPKSYYVYDTNNSNAVPDVWFEPTIIFEVLTADLSLSPIYKAGHQEYGKGISLRFPRFLRIRDDKGIEDATSSTQVSEFYERQANVG